MDCINQSLALHSLISISLIIAGSKLMMSVGRVSRGYGAYCFALGYLLLGLAASGSRLENLNIRDHRYLLGMASVVAIVAGTFMMYYHVQEAVSELLKDRLENLPALKENIINSIPIVDSLLLYGGLIGLAVTIGMRRDGSIDMMKLGMAVAALAVVGYTKRRMLEAVISGKDVQRAQLIHIASYLLIVLAIAYKC